MKGKKINKTKIIGSNKRKYKESKTWYLNKINIEGHKDSIIIISPIKSRAFIW